MAGFYVLAGSLAFALVWLVYAEVAYANRLDLKLAFVCIAGSFAIVKGCFFIADKFEPPGPRVTEKEEPKLFAMIHDVAARMGAGMPTEVYIVPDPNAYVAQVGGFMGIVGARRIMGIGLGFLNCDSIGQLKATIAHEFGHFQGGDTKLGGFIYRTRASIGRVVRELGEGSWLSWPFVLYGKLFLRLTHAIARRQELTADEYSVALAGKAAHVEGLRREAAAGVVFSEFLRGELTPLLEEGCVPANLFEGFRRFMDNLGEGGAIARLGKALEGQATDPYDSHPALPDRIAYAQSLADSGAADEPALSRTLLADPEAMERQVTRRMLARVLAAPADREPRTIAWEDVAGAVYAARMTRASEALAKALGEGPGGGVEGALKALASPRREDVARQIAPGAFADPSEDPREAVAGILGSVAAARIALTLVGQYGYRWEGTLGKPLVVRGPRGDVVEPYALVQDAAGDPARVGELEKKLRELGLGRS
jgi:Zn-dependent protease with chaperone function